MTHNLLETTIVNLEILTTIETALLISIRIMIKSQHGTARSVAEGGRSRPKTRSLSGVSKVREAGTESMV